MGLGYFLLDRLLQNGLVLSRPLTSEYLEGIVFEIPGTLELVDFLISFF